MYTQEDHSTGKFNATNHSQPGTTQMEYAPDDFSQSAINRGQRQINYALTVVNQKLAKAIEALKDAIQASPAGHNIDFDSVEEAICEAYQLNRRVADIKPPGCETTWN